jgi:hypothetical protein
MAQKPIGYYGEFRPTGVDTSAARRFEALAGLANQVGDIAFQIGAKKAEQVGAEKGEKAGREYAAKLAKPQPKVGPPEEMAPPETKKGFLASMSIEGQAYDTAMKSAYLSQVSTDAKEQIERIAAQYPNDVKAFKFNIGKYTQGLLQGVGDEFQDSVSATISNYANNAETQVFKNVIARNRELAKDSVNARLDGLTREVSEISRAGDRLQAETSLLDYETLIDSQLAIGEIDLDVANEQKRQARIKLESGLLKSEFSDDVEASNYTEAYKKLRAFDKPASFTPGEWESFKATAAAEIGRDQSIYNASKKVADQNAKKAVQNFEAAIALGYDVPPEEIAKIERQVAGTPLEKEFESTQRLAQFSLMPSSQRQKVLSEANTGILENASEHQKLLVTEQNIQKELAKDPLAFGQRQGIVNLNTFDPFSPESLTSRLSQAEIASTHYGIPVAPITDTEAQALSDQITKMTVPEKIALAETLQQAPEIWGTIAGKNQAVFSQAGAIGDRNIMQRVFEGQEAIALKTVQSPSARDYLSPFEDYVGNVYGLEDKAATRDAALAYYAATQTPGLDFDKDLFIDSIEAVTGGIAKVNGFKTQLPRGIDDNQFNEFIDAIDQQFIDENGGLGFIDPVTGTRNPYPETYINDVIKNSEVTNKNNSEYLFTNGSSVFVRMDNGQPFTFSYDVNVVARQKANKATRRRESRTGRPLGAVR